MNDMLNHFPNILHIFISFEDVWRIQSIAQRRQFL
jgi:hypothetical protein